MKAADLHIHTYFSDSSASPEEVVEGAVQARLGCIAITDHDTVDGIPRARQAAQKSGIEVLAGVELSTELNGRDIHVLGYLFDESDVEFIERVKQILQTRSLRMKEMIKRLKTLGIDNIDFEEVAAVATSSSIGRPHLAKVMQQKGVVASMQEAFDKYLADDAPGYVPKFKQTPQEAITMIRKAGGVSILAHPMVTQMDEIIPRLVREGLDGLEVYYPNTPPSVIRFYEGLADKHRLLMSGGSDAHGVVKPNTCIGKVSIPYTLVEKLKERSKRKG
ncbi:MAG TPA: PHP domain-containing protein [Candidatus Omnitrophota bacterium]|nr:PHP domain-containing protein [Candidatus Omnitrophota bacterium]